MHDTRHFFTFATTPTVVEYMEFYVNQEESGYHCFSKSSGGEIPEGVRQLMMEPTPETVTRACHILDSTIERAGEKDKQFLYFQRYFLPYFDNLMVGEFFDEFEEESVFLARGDDTITYDQINASWQAIRDPSVKFAAEMGIDIWEGLYSMVDDPRIGDKVLDVISDDDHAEMYRDIIFDAAAASDDYIVPALVNIFLHAYEIVKAENPSNELGGDESDDDIIMT